MENFQENNQQATQNAIPQFFNAAGTRAPKSVNEDVIIAESTRASFRLMPAICAKLGVTDASYITMQLTKDDSGVITGVYIGKGKDAVFARNEDGSIKIDERKRKVVDVEGYGALAAETTPGSNVLKISVASAWDALGNTETKKYYTLAENGITAHLPIGNGEVLTTTLYKLEFEREEEKMVRESKKAEASEDTATKDVAGDEATSDTAPYADVTEYPSAPSMDNDEF